MFNAGGVLKLFLGSDERKRVGVGDDPAPGLGVLELVALQPRVMRLVEHRQVDLAQVDEAHRKPAVLLGDAAKPLAYGECRRA